MRGPGKDYMKSGQTNRQTHIATLWKHRPRGPMLWKIFCLSILGIYNLTRALQSSPILRRKNLKNLKNHFFSKNLKILKKKKIDKKYYFLTFANWWYKSLTRNLWSSPFQNPGGGTLSVTDGGGRRKTEILVSNIGCHEGDV